MMTCELVIFIAVGSLLISSGQVEGKPNIIFMMIDDLGWANVGWHNPAPDNAQTPFSAQLVKDGIELDRHYTFIFCSPSRSSFMSGRFPYHVQQFNYPNFNLAQGIPRNMTALGTKMKAGGYRTAMFGKWHVGCASWGQIPQGRGFDVSLNYFDGAEDHWTQHTCQDEMCIAPITVNDTKLSDLWENDHPASNLNNTEYGGYLYTGRAVNFINTHDASTGPLFMYLALQVNHSPLEVPDKYLERYSSSQFLDRRIYNGMTDFWDEAVKNVTDALKTKGFWNNTLFVLSSDNGGPVYWSENPQWNGGGGANNYPLRGGKISNFEGGVRTAAFVSGGLVPSEMRGKKLKQLMHVADWYATFCELADVDPFDSEAEKVGLPPVDSISLWPLLSGKNMSSPRNEIPLVIDMELTFGNASGYISHALIRGKYKFIQGPVMQNFWQGPDFPNSTHYGVLNETAGVCGQLHPTTKTTTGGCIFDLDVDPTEHNDLAAQMPDLVNAMEIRIKELTKSHFQVASNNKEIIQSWAQVHKNGGFWGPWRP